MQECHRITLRQISQSIDVTSLRYQTETAYLKESLRSFCFSGHTCDSVVAKHISEREHKKSLLDCPVKKERLLLFVTPKALKKVSIRLPVRIGGMRTTQLDLCDIDLLLHTLVNYPSYVDAKHILVPICTPQEHYFLLVSKKSEKYHLEYLKFISCDQIIAAEKELGIDQEDLLIAIKSLELPS